jgi:hypothetical protein
MYQVEIIWNREFHYVPYSTPKNTMGEARELAKSLMNSGDGARVKKARIINAETGVHIESI